MPTGFHYGDPSGDRTPDPLIKSEKLKIIKFIYFAQNAVL